MPLISRGGVLIGMYGFFMLFSVPPRLNPTYAPVFKYQHYKNLESLPPQYRRFKCKKSKSVAVSEFPSMVLGIVQLHGATVDLQPS